MSLMNKTKQKELLSLCTRALEIYEAGAFSPVEVSSSHLLLLPGLCDVHVHLREPGFSYKETIASGTAAAARGGYSTVLSMPNLSPVPDTLEHLQEQLDIIQKDARIGVIPYGAITMGEKGECLADMDAMAPYVCGFSDDGRGVQSESMMRSAMEKARSLNKLIVAHCEQNDLLHGGYIHDGAYAKAHGHRGICSESEYLPIIRDIKLAEETGVSYHVCHISCKESVDAIRAAKARGVDITCETAPHYLVLSDQDLQEDGRFKMNPPLRSPADREALIEGLADGTIDMIATDHAPHSEQEKSRGLEKSPFGITGIETAFPVLYTYLVKKGLISIGRLCEALCIAPRRRFGIPYDSSVSVFDLAAPFTIKKENLVSMGRATPFDGRTVYGNCLLQFRKGVITWKDYTIED